MHALKIQVKNATCLLLIKMLFTIAFGVTYSTLVLYMTHDLKLNEITSISLLASFLAYVGIIRIVAGFLGDRYLSYRSILLIGLISTIIGCILISIPNTEFLYWGIAVFTIGSGFIVAVNCLLTQQFQLDDKQREKAFLLNYSGTNIGWLIGFLLSGYFQLYQAYHALFLISSVGACFAILIIAYHWQNLQNIKKVPVRINGFVIIGIMLITLYFLFNHVNLSNYLIIAVSLILILLMLVIALRQATIESQNKMFAYFILMMISFVFWTLFHLTPMAMTLFIERNVDRSYMGLIISPQWVQMISNMIIILGGPLLVVLFRLMRSKGMKLFVPLQFSLALLTMGIAFLILFTGICFANANGYIHFNWIIASYIIQGLAELFIAPIGFAVIGQLVPINLQGMMMGIWMMSIGSSATLSGYLSKMIFSENYSIDPLMSNPIFSSTFVQLGGVSILIGIILLLCNPILLRLMQVLNVKQEVTQ